MPLVRRDCQFLAPALHGDRCEVRSRIARFGGASFVVAHEMVRDDGTRSRRAARRASGARYVDGPGTPLKGEPIPEEVKALFRAKVAHSPSAASIIAPAAPNASCGWSCSSDARFACIAVSSTSRPSSASAIAAMPLAAAQTSSRSVNHWLCHWPRPRSCSGVSCASSVAARPGRALRRLEREHARAPGCACAACWRSRRARLRRPPQPRRPRAASAARRRGRSCRRRRRGSPAPRRAARSGRARCARAPGSPAGSSSSRERRHHALARARRTTTACRSGRRTAARTRSLPRGARRARLRASIDSQTAAFQPKVTGSAGCSSVRAAVGVRAWRRASPAAASPSARVSSRDPRAGRLAGTARPRCRSRPGWSRRRARGARLPATPRRPARSAA